MGIMYVTNLKACTLTGKTARTQGRQTTLVRHLCQWIGLIHELRQCVRSKETINDAGYGLGVYQVCRCEHFIIANVHTLTNRTGHTSKTYCKLVAQLFANRTDVTITQVVNIINCSLRVNQLYEILDNFNDIFFSQDTYAGVCI